MGLWIALASNIGVDDGGDGSYTWRIPHGSSRVEDRCRIRVIANDGNQQQGLDVSDADFSIEYAEKPGDEPDPSQGGSVPAAPVLLDPAPNPFNPSTTIRYGVSERCAASMVVYDVAGRRIRTLIESRPVDPGYHSIDWDGRNDAGAMAGTGVYFVRFTAGRFVASRKLNLIR